MERVVKVDHPGFVAASANWNFVKARQCLGQLHLLCLGQLNHTWNGLILSSEMAHQQNVGKESVVEFDPEIGGKVMGHVHGREKQSDQLVKDVVGERWERCSDQIRDFRIDGGGDAYDFEE